jgi:integrase
MPGAGRLSAHAYPYCRCLRAASLPTYCPVTPKARVRGKRPVGERWTTGSYSRAVLHGARRAGVPEWHVSQLRHAAATEIQAAESLDAARSVLGHRDAQITTRYAAADLNAAARVAARLG